MGGNSNSSSSILRCWLACILPCGALDLIRIVHSNGYVEELTGRVTAGDVLKNYPDHVLSKPSAGGASLIVSPESDLKRGSIYFLQLVPSSSSSSSLPAAAAAAHHKTSKQPYYNSSSSKQRLVNVNVNVNVNVKAQKKKPRLRRRKVTAGEWHPHLDSISEDF